MEKKIAAFTLFTFLFFAVTNARFASDPVAVDRPVVYYTSNAVKPSPESVAGDSSITLPSEKSKSESDETAVAVAVHDRFPESEKTRTYTVNTIDLKRRSNFVGFRPINRHFLDRPRIPLRRRPCKHMLKSFMIPRSEISYGNDAILSGKTGSSDQETDRAKRMKFRHGYGHKRHHDEEHNGFIPRNMFDREKVKSLMRQHKEKKREHDFSFMKRIRKFLKHTFD